ncbi:MAG: tetratricopeptide repeat protein [Chloroflexota bacterium]
MTRSFRLLGTLEITENGRLSPLMKSAKGCALLAYLIITNQSQTRAHVANLFWSETSTAAALRNLRKLIHTVRRHAPELMVTRQTVSLQFAENPHIDHWLVQAALAQEDLQQLDESLHHYRGDLLATFYFEDAPVFNEWLIVAREQLRAQVTSAYHRLCTSYYEAQAWEMGLDASWRWLALDDLHEETQRWLIKFMAASGQLAAAQQQYETCRSRLWEELAVEPEAATQELMAQLSQLATEQEVALPQPPAWQPDQLPSPDQLPAVGSLPPQSALPYQRNNDFTGRLDDLVWLGQQLLPWEEGKESRDWRLQEAPNLQSLFSQSHSSTVAISGMGGLGKTQLAVEYAYRYGRFYAGGVYWLSFAQTENVVEEVAAVGGERGMQLYSEADKLTLADQVGRVQQAWQEATPRLLIFDNCEDEQLLEEWLPVTGGCRVLLTSRRSEWARERNVAVRPLATLTRPDSLTLIQQLAPHTANAPDALDQIAANLGDLPLALHLAGSFLQRYQRITPAAYLQQLDRIGLLQHPSLQGRGVTHSPTRHELNVARTFAINFEQLDVSNEVDAMALRLLACAISLAHGEPIPQTILLNASLSDPDDLMAELLAVDGLARLVELGILTLTENKTTQIHRLLATYAKEVLLAPEPLNDASIAVENSLIRLLAEQNKGTYGLATLPIPSAHLSHIIEQAQHRSDRRAIQLLLLWGCHQRDSGSYKAAEDSFQLASHLQGQLADLAELEKTELLSQLGELYIRMGRYGAARSCYEQYLRILEETPNITPLQLAEGLDQQGMVYASLGAFEVAQEYLEKAVSLYREHLGPDDPFFEYYLGNLAVLNFWQGDYQSAWQLAEPHLKAAEKMFGAEHLETVAALNFLGECLFCLGRIEEAAAAYEQARTILKQQGTLQHSQTAYNSTGLGQICLVRGQLVEAEQYLKQGLAIRAKIRGSQHKYTAQTLIQLGDLHLKSGNYETAKAYLDQVFDIRQAEFGDQHPETAESLVLLGEWYLLAQNDKEKAKSLFEQAQKTLAERVVPTHVAFQRVQRNLAAMEE